MPRFIRPVFCWLFVDGQKDKKFSPKSRRGKVRARFDVRENGKATQNYMNIFFTPGPDGTCTSVTVKVRGEIVFEDMLVQ